MNAFSVDEILTFAHRQIFLEFAADVSGNGGYNEHYVRKDDVSAMNRSYIRKSVTIFHRRLYQVTFVPNVNSRRNDI